MQQLYKQGSANIAHSNVGISNGLVGYWTMDGPSIDWRKNQVSDMSGNGNTGTLINMSTSSSPTAGKIGQALKFDGSSSYVNTVDDPLDITGDITVSCWAKMDNKTNYNPLVSKYNYGADHGWQLINADVGDGHVTFGGRTGSGTYSTSGSSLTDITGKWHHIVGERSGSTWSIYVDGVLENSATGGTGTLANNRTMEIGQDTDSPPGSYNFPGIIDDVRIYNRALSAQEVQQLYNAGRP